MDVVRHLATNSSKSPTVPDASSQKTPQLSPTRCGSFNESRKSKDISVPVLSFSIRRTGDCALMQGTPSVFEEDPTRNGISAVPTGQSAILNNPLTKVANNADGDLPPVINDTNQDDTRLREPTKMPLKQEEDMTVSDNENQKESSIKKKKSKEKHRKKSGKDRTTHAALDKKVAGTKPNKPIESHCPNHLKRARSTSKVSVKGRLHASRHNRCISEHKEKYCRETKEDCLDATASGLVAYSSDETEDSAQKTFFALNKISSIPKVRSHLSADHRYTKVDNPKKISESTKIPKVLKSTAKSTWDSSDSDFEAAVVQPAEALRTSAARVIEERDVGHENAIEPITSKHREKSSRPAVHKNSRSTTPKLRQSVDAKSGSISRQSSNSFKDRRQQSSSCSSSGSQSSSSCSSRRHRRRLRDHSDSRYSSSSRSRSSYTSRSSSSASSRSLHSYSRRRHRTRRRSHRRRHSSSRSFSRGHRHRSPSSRHHRYSRSDSSRRYRRRSSGSYSSVSSVSSSGASSVSRCQRSRRDRRNRRRRHSSSHSAARTRKRSLSRGSQTPPPLCRSSYACDKVPSIGITTSTAVSPPESRLARLGVGPLGRAISSLGSGMAQTHKPSETIVAAANAAVRKITGGIFSKADSNTGERSSKESNVQSLVDDNISKETRNGNSSSNNNKTGCSDIIPLPTDCTTNASATVDSLNFLPPCSRPEEKTIHATYIGPQVPPEMAKKLGLAVCETSGFSTTASTNFSVSQSTSVSEAGWKHMSAHVGAKRKSEKVSSSSETKRQDTGDTKSSLEFVIPPEQAEEYKALQAQAREHALRRSATATAESQSANALAILQQQQQLALFAHLQQQQQQQQQQAQLAAALIRQEQAQQQHESVAASALQQQQQLLQYLVMSQHLQPTAISAQLPALLAAVAAQQQHQRQQQQQQAEAVVAAAAQQLGPQLLQQRQQALAGVGLTAAASLAQQQQLYLWLLRQQQQVNTSSASMSALASLRADVSTGSAMKPATPVANTSVGGDAVSSQPAVAIAVAQRQQQEQVQKQLAAVAQVNVQQQQFLALHAAAAAAQQQKPTVPLATISASPDVVSVFNASALQQQQQQASAVAALAAAQQQAQVQALLQQQQQGQQSQQALGAALLLQSQQAGLLNSLRMRPP